MHIARLTLCISALLMAACTTPRPTISKEAIEDFIFANQMEEQKQLRRGRSDSWRPLNTQYALYTARRKTYLLEFDRLCYSLLDNFDIEPDFRRNNTYLHAGFDTLRGCFIDNIYAVTDEQATELENLGYAPGENNY